MEVTEVCPACTWPPTGMCQGLHSFKLGKTRVFLPVDEGQRRLAEEQTQQVALRFDEGRRLLQKSQTQQVALRCLALVAVLAVATALYGYRG